MANIHFNESPNVSVAQPVGSIKGTIIKKGGPVFDYFTQNIVRRTLNGNLQVYGWMRIPGEESDYRVVLQFANENAPSGTYIVGTPDITLLYIDFPPGSGFRFNASSGQITFQNHAPGEVRLNGKMEFETENLFGDEYDVDLIFEVTGELETLSAREN